MFDIIEYFLGMCYICEEEGKFNICNKCRSQLQQNTVKCVLCTDFCLHGKSFVPYFYNQMTSNILMQLKYGNNTRIAKLIAQEISNIIPDDLYTLTFVPMSRKRLFTRTYNQAHLIANELSKLRGWPCDNFIFKKIDTTSQRNASVEQRYKNALSIELDKPNFYDKVIIIDDLIASGATISRCYDLLRDFYDMHNFDSEISIAAFAKSL